MTTLSELRRLHEEGAMSDSPHIFRHDDRCRAMRNALPKLLAAIEAAVCPICGWNLFEGSGDRDCKEAHTKVRAALEGT